MKITQSNCKLFLDSGNPDDTKRALALLGRLDGQTTNPSLVAKNPEIQQLIAEGHALSDTELLDKYRQIIQQIATLIPHGSISIEVYADFASTADELLSQAQLMNQWIDNAHIKFPITHEGLDAAHRFTRKGGKANMTLGFTQEQALAVHQATLGVTKGDVFYSSFVGRVFDKGLNGIELLHNIITQYKQIGSTVEVLAASFRNLNQLKGAIKAGSDIVTIPPNLLEEWSKDDFELEPDFVFSDLLMLPVEAIKIPSTFNWKDDLDIPQQTIDGVAKFALDWNALLN